MNKIIKFNELNENVNNNIIDYDKLVQYANAIKVLCNGEYGITFYNEKENHVFICLGDSNPFDDRYLESYMKEAITKGSYKNQELIKITIENECYPNSNEEGWVKIS